MKRQNFYSSHGSGTPRRALAARVAELEAQPLKEVNAQAQLDELKKQMDIATANNLQTATARVVRGPVAAVRAGGGREARSAVAAIAPSVGRRW